MVEATRPGTLLDMGIMPNAMFDAAAVQQQTFGWWATDESANRPGGLFLVEGVRSIGLLEINTSSQLGASERGSVEASSHSTVLLSTSPLDRQSTRKHHVFALGKYSVSEKNTF
jgi:hypothetical protein